MPQNETGIKGFYLHFSQCDALFNLPPESVVRALKMCCEYCRGESPESDDPMANCAFGLMRPALDKSMQLAENGRKGGKANRKQIEANVSKPEADLSKSKQIEANAKQIEAKEQRTKNKEQEIKNKEEREDTYSSAPQAGALQASASTDADALVCLPLNDGSVYVITQAIVDECRELYPAVDVLQELRNMRGWFLGNPTKLKTRRGIGRFVHSWLSKAQDKAGRPEQRRLSFQEEREQRELEKFLNDDRPLWGMTGDKNNGQDPF